MNIYSLLSRVEEIKMPNQDGTGPEGKGSITGRGVGKCEGAKVCPRGRAKGRGRGRKLNQT